MVEVESVCYWLLSFNDGSADLVQSQHIGHTVRDVEAVSRRAGLLYADWCICRLCCNGGSQEAFDKTTLDRVATKPALWRNFLDACCCYFVGTEGIPSRGEIQR